VLRGISFQTEYGREVKRNFRERMLNCDANDDELDYLLSHAYWLDQIFVFYRSRRTADIFLENITTKVRIAASSHRLWIPSFNFNEDTQEDDKLLVILD